MEAKAPEFEESELLKARTLLICYPSRAADLRTSPASKNGTSVAPLTTNSELTEAADAVTLFVGGVGDCESSVEIRLPHAGKPSVSLSFLFADNNLYEINSFRRLSGTTSAFLEDVDCVLGSAPLLLATPVDPLFLFTTLLHRHASTVFRPLKDILQCAAYSEDVQQNLKKLASLPQVCQRLYLICDIYKSQKEKASPPSGMEPEDSAFSQEHVVEIGDCCRFSMKKTATFLDRVTRRAESAFLEQQRKRHEQQRIIVRECVPAKRHPSVAPRPDEHFPTLVVADSAISHTIEHGKRSNSSEFAAKRLVEEYISAYVPKTVLDAVKPLQTLCKQE